jgi:anaerobic selenocysteine-containing dehydrogenase
MLNRPAIAPVGQALPNAEIFRRIARALGFDDDCFHESDEQILATFVDAQRDPALANITWQRLQDEHHCRLDVPTPYLPFAEGKFPTPSGRCELYSERMLADGYDPLPSYIAPDVSSDPREQILHCISPPAHSFLNSTFVNIDKFAAREREPLLIIHGDDARGRGITDGATVRVANERGELQLRARVSDEVVRGTVVAPSIWWNKLSPQRRNINVLSSPDETDMGAGALFFDTPVLVTPLSPEAL